MDACKATRRGTLTSSTNAERVDLPRRAHEVLDVVYRLTAGEDQRKMRPAGRAPWGECVRAPTASATLGASGGAGKGGVAKARGRTRPRIRSTVSAWRFPREGGLRQRRAHGGGEQGERGGEEPSRQQPSAIGRAGRYFRYGPPGRYFIYRPALRFSGSSSPKSAVQIRYDGLPLGRPLGLVEAQQLESVLLSRRPITEESTRTRPRIPVV
jgi:hypothetical protein